MTSVEILERARKEEISYLALSGRKALRFLIIADVPALAAYVHSYSPESKRAFTLGESNLSFFPWHWNRGGGITQ